MTNEDLGCFLGQPCNPGELRRRVARDLCVAGLGENIDPPTGQLGREANVLAAPSDCLGELIVRDDEFHGVRVLVDKDTADVGRRNRVNDKPCGVWVEGDDVDGFASKLLDDRLDPGALETDASADRIYIAVRAGNRDLGPMPWFACTGFDADDAFVDFRYLELEQLHQ